MFSSVVVTCFVVVRCFLDVPRLEVGKERVLFASVEEDSLLWYTMLDELRLEVGRKGRCSRVQGYLLCVVRCL